jgi:hypothetical protein
LSFLWKSWAMAATGKSFVPKLVLKITDGVLIGMTYRGLRHDAAPTPPWPPVMPRRMIV